MRYGLGNYKTGQICLEMINPLLKFVYMCIILAEILRNMGTCIVPYLIKYKVINKKCKNCRICSVHNPK